MSPISFEVEDNRVRDSLQTMSTITIDIPEDLARRLQPYSDHLSTILEIGLHQFDPHQSGVEESDFATELDSIINFLDQSPSDEEIVALRASKALQAQIGELLERNRYEGLTAAEEAWWEKLEYVEHLVRIAKAKALHQLNA